MKETDVLLGLGSAVSVGAVGNSLASTAMEGARGLMGVAGRLWLAYQEKTELCQYDINRKEL